jgi:hypothetical protein
MWTAQDGSVRASYELNAESVRFIGGRDGGGSAAGDSYEAPAAQEEDEIPF